jgi:peptidylprolyl isomerase
MKAWNWLLILVIMVGGLAAVSCGDNTALITQKTGEGTVIKFKETGAKPYLLADLNKKYTATIDVAGKGKMVFELFAKDAPKAVSNFVYLSVSKFYDGTTFHRVIQDFMAQGGDPQGTGLGGPGYGFGLEISSHKHIAGALSMAHSSLPNSNGSQFFICFKAASFLDGQYSVFGQLTSGMNVLNSISLRDPDTATTPGDKITSITITVE